MELRLQNIGMIKEANVKLDGLTVIAGENDTGKSTVGKALYTVIKYYQTLFTEREDNQWNVYRHTFKEDFNTNKHTIVLKTKEAKIAYGKFHGEPSKPHQAIETIFIETPLIWNFTDFFRDIAQVESQINIKLDYPYLMKDLNFKLHIKSASKGLDIKDEMVSLMGGEFKKDELGHYYFDKHGERIELLNTATGIKMFGIFQILSQNNYLNQNTVLILDEPEVHLHPKWQLEMAKMIVELVKNGVTVLLNSHSPYMIEALKRYAERAGIESKTNFYLAEDNYIKQIEESNSLTLSRIFEKLSEPFDVFEEMDSQRMEQLING